MTDKNDLTAISRFVRGVLLLQLAIFASFTLKAQSQTQSSDGAELRQLYEPIFSDIRYMGADLIDELVYEWKAHSPSAQQKDVVLVSVNAPMSLDERFTIFVENRFYELLTANADIPFHLVYCGVCQQFIVKSTRKGTLLSRGYDQPEVLKSLVEAFPGRLGVALDFEVEGKELLLRAHLFELNETQKIIWAKTFSTSMTSARILRETSPLVSLDVAREQQRKLMSHVDPLEIVTRIVASSFTAAKSTISPPPLPFVEQSFEAVPLPDRDLRAAVTVGFMSLRDSFEAWSFGGHAAKLLGRKTPSLVNPDFYIFMGLKYMRIRGPDADIFRGNQFDYLRILDTNSEPRASLMFYRLGIEAHIKFRLGALAFLEYSPQLKENDLVETSSYLGIPYQSLGMGVLIRW